MAEDEAANSERSSLEPIPQSQAKPKRRLKAIVIGIGVCLVIIGVALAAYVATHEDEPFLIALGPAFIGVIVIIAALFGKKL